LELYGSRAANPIDQDTDRALNALEGLVGVKHDYTQSLALHAGLTRQVVNSIGGADWRLYAGLNWAMGSVRDAPAIESVTPPPTPVVASATPTAPPAPVIQVLKLDVDLFFAFGSDQVDPKLLGALEPHVQKIKQSGFESIVVEGHTDSIGPDVYNQYLSGRRAEAVREQMIQKFQLPAEKIKAIGFGSSKPIADNGNYQGRRKNRRVELIITSGPSATIHK
jgi:OmpA-OmpF porin, OOP family